MRRAARAKSSAFFASRQRACVTVRARRGRGDEAAHRDPVPIATRSPMESRARFSPNTHAIVCTGTGLEPPARPDIQAPRRRSSICFSPSPSPPPPTRRAPSRLSSAYSRCAHRRFCCRRDNTDTATTPAACPARQPPRPRLPPRANESLFNPRPSRFSSTLLYHHIRQKPCITINRG